MDLVVEERNESEDVLDTENDMWMQSVATHENEMTSNILFCDENTEGTSLIYDLLCL